MKNFLKKIGMVVLILVLVAIYCNTGYWIGQEWDYSRALTRAINFDTNIVQKFLVGPKEIFAFPDKDVIVIVKDVVFTALWPLLLGANLLCWIGYLTLCGALFETIGLVGSLILAVAAGVLVVVMLIMRRRRTEPTT
jgi:hypothetical protein